MPLPEPKGGLMALPSDTTRGQRGDPRDLGPQGGPKRLPAPDAPEGEEIGTRVRGGNTDGVMYESRLRQRTPTTGDGTGQ
jgi:hypothetical protein